MQTAEVTWFAFLYKSEWRFRQAIIKKIRNGFNNKGVG